MVHFVKIFLLAGLCLPLAATDTGVAYHTPDMRIRDTVVRYHANLDLLVFSLRVQGRAGRTQPRANGELNGAPVLGYVFPTTLAPRDVGFIAEDGLVALAVTAHPDFDDTPLWDENNNGDYADDGPEWHTHWVLLEEDSRVPGGLAVREIATEDAATVLPPTNPGMPMYMDSPGFGLSFSNRTLHVLVPAQRVSGNLFFNYDAVAVFMRVDTNPEKPLLGVYQVYSTASEDLSLPYGIRNGRLK
ncbi:hypothetical protein [Acanthopleuribacter pedis]|uniref:Uncharacterized protein n=1 Tax=Acanthopleuribacter pedis TaxID=442870 RepID=A0A8J7U379_9BACT|nr:hypothetical protein [Acanthopleuribacter pedis]MBO1316986.1 hypothetical protein [Acanthopleuribacter pedis]